MKGDIDLKFHLFWAGLRIRSRRGSGAGSGPFFDWKVVCSKIIINDSTPFHLIHSSVSQIGTGVFLG